MKKVPLRWKKLGRSLALPRRLDRRLALPALLACAALLMASRAAAEEGAEPKAASFKEWQAKIAETLEDLRVSVSSRDRLALLKELAEHIKEPIEPRADYIAELKALLGKAPAGVLLNTLVHTLVAERSPPALEALFDVFDRKDFEAFDGRPLPEGEIEMRHRIVETNLMLSADRAFEERTQRAPGSKTTLDLTEESRKALATALAAPNTRRVRSAAYLLGGWGVVAVAPALLESLRKAEDPWTGAILIEALGRTDPAAASAVILNAAAEGKDDQKLAAIPVLGLLRGEEAEGEIKKAIENSSWFVRRAAIAACQNRRDTFAGDLLIPRFQKEPVARLQNDIYTVLLDLTGGVLPPDPAEWPKWWGQARTGFRAAPRGQEASAEEGRKTKLVVSRYFGLEVWSNQLAILFDVSASMGSTNISLGLSGVGVEGSAGKGSPLDLAREQITKLVKAFPKKTKFNLIAYSDNAKALAKNLFPATPANAQKAQTFLKGLKANGETNLYGALELTLKDPEVDTVYLLSDGEPTRGSRIEPTDIIEAVARVNRFRQTTIHTILFGEEIELMKLLAKYSGGSYKNIGLKPTAEGQKPAKVGK